MFVWLRIFLTQPISVSVSKISSLAWEAIDSKASGSSIWSRPMALLLHHRRMVITRAVAELFGGFTGDMYFQQRYVFLLNIPSQRCKQNAFKYTSISYSYSISTLRASFHVGVCPTHAHEDGTLVHLNSRAEKDGKQPNLKTNINYSQIRQLKTIPFPTCNIFQHCATLPLPIFGKGHYQMRTFSDMLPHSLCLLEPLWFNLRIWLFLGVSPKSYPTLGVMGYGRLNLIRIGRSCWLMCKIHPPNSFIRWRWESNWENPQRRRLSMPSSHLFQKHWGALHSPSW